MSFQYMKPPRLNRKYLHTTQVPRLPEAESMSTNVEYWLPVTGVGLLL